MTVAGIELAAAMFRRRFIVADRGGGRRQRRE